MPITIGQKNKRGVRGSTGEELAASKRPNNRLTTHRAKKKSKNQKRLTLQMNPTFKIFKLYLLAYKEPQKISSRKTTNSRTKLVN